MAGVATRYLHVHTLFYGLSAVGGERCVGPFRHRCQRNSFQWLRKTNAPMALYDACRPSRRTVSGSRYRCRVVNVYGYSVAHGCCCLVAQEQKNAQKPTVGKYQQRLSPLCLRYPRVVRHLRFCVLISDGPYRSYFFVRLVPTRHVEAFRATHAPKGNEAVGAATPIATCHNGNRCFYCR